MNESETRGFVDYLLLDDDGHPIIVIEAKKEAIHPLDAKEQARDYAYGKRCRFVVLSNGNTHYFWDTETGNPQIITEFPSLESLYHRREFKPNKDKLADEAVDAGYLARIKNKDFERDPRYIEKSKRVEFLFDKFQDIEELDADLVPSAKWFFSAYLQDKAVRDVIESKEYGRLPTMPGVDMQAFQKLAQTKRNGDTYAQYIPTYIHDYLGNLKEFERV